MKEKEFREFGCQVSALWLSWQAESILEDMGEDFESIASYYLKDEVMSGLAKLKKTMGGKNNG